MDVLEKAQELERNGEHIIHLEVGEPDFDTPECINEACYRAICEGKTHYTHSLGLIELREAIAEDYWNKYKVRVSPEQILIASGTSPAMLLLFAALLEPERRGDPFQSLLSLLSQYHSVCRRSPSLCQGVGRGRLSISS